ncbi:PIN domain-containing protein [Deinococcus sp. AJ005]|uniref:PIN domain-containing protein n=1 Tax=Deinococcus sp. AJ005 TaxID=2652443 RepID=UPI00351B8C32
MAHFFSQTLAIGRRPLRQSEPCPQWPTFTWNPRPVSVLPQTLAPDDWPTTRLGHPPCCLTALPDCAIWIRDRDFFGCGLSMWRTDMRYGVLNGAEAG